MKSRRRFEGCQFSSHNNVIIYKDGLLCHKTMKTKHLKSNFDEGKGWFYFWFWNEVYAAFNKTIAWTGYPREVMWVSKW